MNNPLIIIQARYNSKRLPGKVLKSLGKFCVLYYVSQRCRQNSFNAKVLVATSKEKSDDPIVDYCKEINLSFFRGDLNDVLDRYYHATSLYQANPIIRITGDCPLIEPHIINRVYHQFQKHPYDYIYFKGYPRGIGDVELLSNKAIVKCWAETKPGDTYFREHVMTYIMKHPEKFDIFIDQVRLSDEIRQWRLCIDESDDYKLVSKVCEHFSPKIFFHFEDIVQFFKENPSLSKQNIHVQQLNV